MKFKDLRKVWADKMYLIVKDGAETVHLFQSIYPFDAVEKYPWLDECEVWGIHADMYISDNEVAADEVIICKMN